jgi:hypothetical protein
MYGAARQLHAAVGERLPGETVHGTDRRAGISVLRILGRQDEEISADADTGFQKAAVFRAAEQQG